MVSRGYLFATVMGIQTSGGYYNRLLKQFAYTIGHDILSGDQG